MKALFRSSAGLLALLVAVSVSHAQGYWVTPVFRQPYPVAPSPSNSGFYLPDAYGRWTGPHYYLVPPVQPFNGILPGKTGQAIQQGFLPHQLLLSKEGMDLGKVPLLGQKNAPQGPQGPPPPQPMPGAGMPAMGFGGASPAPNMGMMQMPYGPMPNSPFPRQSPYAQPMPPPPMPYAMQPMMPQAMPYAPMPMPQARPIAYMPYYGQPGMYAMAKQDPRTGIWLVQNVAPGQAPTPFRPIPGFNPPMPAPMMPGNPFGQGTPFTPGMPMMAPPPGPGNGMQQFGPTDQFTQFQQFPPLQGPQPPQMGMVPMQLPRMEMAPPPPQKAGMAYPTHPFIRSPRDFFMWGDNMDEERARGNRPFPVP